MYLVFRTQFVMSLLTAVSFGLAACIQEPQGVANITIVKDSSMDEGALAAVVLKDWDSLKTATMEFGDAMPAENFDYKPKEELRNFGEQLMHVASAHLFYMGNLDTDAARPDLGEPVEKVDVLQALSDSFDFGTEILSGQTDASLREMVDGGYLGESSRARIAYQAMIHTRQEYGVMTVYLRLNDIVPPASQ
jgi:hypothetical protein